MRFDAKVVTAFLKAFESGRIQLRRPTGPSTEEFRPPEITLIDGRGRRHTPWSTDPEELRAYTFGEQVVAPYDFTASVRVALREHAPDRLVCPGPGNTLGGVCGQILIEEGWRGTGSRADFDALQASDEPVLVSMRR